MGGSVSSETSGLLISSTNAEADATVDTQWDDISTIDVPTIADGTMVKVDAALELKGSYAAGASGSVVANQHFASWSVAVKLTGLGLLDHNNATGTTLLAGGTGDIIQSLNTQIVDMVIPISYMVPVGEADYIGEELTTFGGASVTTYASAPGTVSSFFSAQFSDTLSWGGITDVIDPDTGLPITDWTVSSQSGFDYSQPAPDDVPEPVQTSVLMLAATALLARCRTCARTHG